MTGARPRLAISEYIDEGALALLEEVLHVRYEPGAFRDAAALRALVADAEGLIVRNGTRVDDALLDAAPALRAVGRLGVGLDNLDLAALERRGVTTTWAPGTNAVSVAEYVMGAMLELSRRFGAVSAELHAGRWDRTASIGSELHGKTLGIVGLGDIGGRLARRADAFGMRLLAADPVIHDASAAVQEYDIEITSFEALLERSDFVSLHAPLVPATRGMLNERTLARFRDGAFLINTARGGLIDERALAAALRSGRPAGAALDVREHEPPGDGDPLRGIENVILTPHVAGVTRESNARASLHVARDMVRVLRGERPLSPVPR